MPTANYTPEEIRRNKKYSEKDVLTLVVSNYGVNTLFVTCRGVKRAVPPLNPTIGVPIAPFKIESYGNSFDVDFEIEFEDGSGMAIVDILKLKPC